MEEGPNNNNIANDNDIVNCSNSLPAEIGPMINPIGGSEPNNEEGMKLSWDEAGQMEFEIEPEIEFFQRARCFPAGKMANGSRKGGTLAGASLKQSFPLCKFCSCDATFMHDGFDPIYRKGIWEKHKLDNVCVKKMSIDEQNNKGKWMVCDIDNMDKCHFYEPEYLD